MAVTNETVFDEVVIFYNETHLLQEIKLRQAGVRLVTPDAVIIAHTLPSESDADVAEVLRRVRAGTCKVTYHIAIGIESATSQEFGLDDLPDWGEDIRLHDLFYRLLRPERWDVGESTVVIRHVNILTNMSIRIPTDSTWLDIGFDRFWFRIRTEDLLAVTPSNNAAMVTGGNTIERTVENGRTINVGRSPANALLLGTDQAPTRVVIKVRAER